MPVKKTKTKTKQKQKQRQHQSIVVNVNQQKAPARRRRNPSSTGSRGGGGHTVVYTNAPSDYAPIIHNIPPMFQQQQTLSLPQSSLENIPSPPLTTQPIPTDLQTVKAEIKPLLSAIKPIIYEENPMNEVRKRPASVSSPLIEELKQEQQRRASGVFPTPRTPMTEAMEKEKEKKLKKSEYDYLYNLNVRKPKAQKKKEEAQQKMGPG